MFREYTTSCLNVKTKLMGLKGLLRHHVPFVDRRALLHHRQLPVSTKDTYLGFEDREIPSRLLDLLERENDCVVCCLHGIALRAESLPFDVSHGIFLSSHFNIDFVNGH
jgi:hypothetical protein